MHRVDVILDLEPENFTEITDEEQQKKTKKGKEKSIKINDELFEIALREGLIEKTEDGYVFIGTYEDALKFKKKAR